jgi:hypothetical protein
MKTPHSRRHFRSSSSGTTEERFQCVVNFRLSPDHSEIVEGGNLHPAGEFPASLVLAYRERANCGGGPQVPRR